MSTDIYIYVYIYIFAHLSSFQGGYFWKDSKQMMHFIILLCSDNISLECVND